MKLDGKRTGLSLALTILLLSPPRAAALEENPYIWTHSGSIHSPFTVEHTITKSDGTVYYSGSSAPEVFLLTCGETKIQTYCADPAVGIQLESKYRAVNLEDSAYFRDAVAGKLRSILQNTYPGKSIDQIQEAANLWLGARELPKVKNLQTGEVILASQIAIWKLTGGDHYTVHALYSGTIAAPASTFSAREQQFPDGCPTEDTPGNVESLYSYFCNLEPTSPNTRLISEETVRRTVYASAQETDGHFTVEGTVTVDIPIEERDNLILQATCGESVQIQEITQGGQYRFVFPDLPERLPVELKITGKQWGEDVFLFDAEGEREVSQTQVGFYRGLLPVLWQRTLKPAAIVAWD